MESFVPELNANSPIKIAGFWGKVGQSLFTFQANKGLQKTSIPKCRPFSNQEDFQGEAQFTYLPSGFSWFIGSAL
jgi:hypothetical protein